MKHVPVRSAAFTATFGGEAPTLVLLTLCYGAWAGLTLAGPPPWLAVPALAVVLTLHSSLQHELLHGHPFRDARLNGALAFPAIGLFVPYLRFRDDHIAHHRDERLTDPYDDPETNFLDPAVWARTPGLLRVLLRFNNTLLGRVTVGPAIGLARFWAGDARALARGDRRLAQAWALHAAGAGLVVLWLWAWGGVSAGAYLAACYGAMAILKIRTFLEHRADADPARRSAIVEDRGPLAWLFLNNNLHALHHARPHVPWSRLPALYRAHQAEVLARNGGYRYPGYAAVFRRHLFRPKDPVPHPLRPAPSHRP
jgi:fatty acid desaturase